MKENVTLISSEKKDPKTQSSNLKKLSNENDSLNNSVNTHIPTKTSQSKTIIYSLEMSSSNKMTAIDDL